MKCKYCYKYSWILYKSSFLIYYDKEKEYLLCPRCMKMAMRYDFEIIVTPRDPGDFGFVCISGVNEYPWETKSKCEKIMRKIKKHVSDIIGDDHRTVSYLT